MGWGLPTFCCNLLRGKTGGKCVSFPHGVAGKKKKKKPFACCRFAQSDANQRRPNRVLGSSRCDTIERPRLRANTGVEKSLSERRSLTEFHLEDLQPFTPQVCISRKWCGGEPRGRQRETTLLPFRCNLGADGLSPCNC